MGREWPGDSRQPTDFGGEDVTASAEPGEVSGFDFAVCWVGPWLPVVSVCGLEVSAELADAVAAGQGFESGFLEARAVPVFGATP